jgi:hypothetical protein
MGAIFFSAVQSYYVLTKNGLFGYILGDFFLKLIWSPCSKRLAASA